MPNSERNQINDFTSKSAPLDLPDLFDEARWDADAGLPIPSHKKPERQSVSNIIKSLLGVLRIKIKSVASEPKAESARL